MSPESCCPRMGRLRRLQARTWVEPVVASTQVAASLYDTGLLLVVKAHFGAGGWANHSASPSPRGPAEDAQQRAISNFYIVYNLVMGLTPLLSAYGLGWLSDRYHRKVAICVPLLGFLLSRLGLLLKLLLDWPLEVMFAAAAVNGLTGGFSAFWSGVMALGSLGSSAGHRSVRLIFIDLVLGLAGFCGSMASGHLFKQIAGHSRQGLVLAACSVSCATFSLCYSLLVLTVPEAPAKSSQGLATVETVSGVVGTYRTLDPDQPEKPTVVGQPPSPEKAKPKQVIIVLLFVGAIIYDLAVVGTWDVMSLFVLRAPLSWNQVQVGYGMAVGYTIFISSFLGVLGFSRCFQDTTMIMIGMVSFGSGALLLAFAKTTYMFYIARGVMMFSLIPITTIRSAMSKLIKGSSYGKVFVILQLSLALTGVVISVAYNEIYQVSMEKFAGTCFALSAFLSFLAIVPIGIVAHRQASWLQCTGATEK
ncbi:thymic stromal cotransporter homolog isoform X2 [Echinops telfairi]|uniref:Thymic stromal cotransporter homolog isoform X2 n=1 Tax=Echinops telfairi TaxID=9371 RepID=A0ABM0IYW8_ECHTE|nr:thymic stromal cotransporter homolog isoform X2 [Echinops telfairi]